MQRLAIVALVLLVAACSNKADPPPAISAPVAAPATAVDTYVAASIDPPAAPGALAPQLGETVDGVVATWLEPTATDEHRLRFARWQRGAWSAPVTIVAGPKIVANWADVPAVAQSGDGTLVAHWAERSGAEPYAYDAVVARSVDGGATWTRLGPLHDDRTETEHGFVSLVGERDGVRAFWLDGRETAHQGAMSLRTARVGAAITAGEVVDDRVCDCCSTAAAIASTGAVVAYRDRTADEVRDIRAARRDGERWMSASTVHADGWNVPGCPVNGPAMAARERRVVVAWYTYAESTHRVKLAFSDDAGVTFGAPVEIDGPRGPRAPLGRVGVALDDDGSAIVSWVASEREDAAVLLRRVTAAGAAGGELRIGRTIAGRDGGFPRLARDGDGLVVMWNDGPAAPRLRAVRVPLTALPGVVPGAPPAAAVRPLITTGVAAPRLELRTLDGAAASLAALRGQVVLLNLWATWCEPCRHELPELATVHRRDSGRGLAIVAINVDRKLAPADIAAFVRRRKLPFAVWRDPDDRASTALGVSTYPVNILVGRDGVVRWRRDGAIGADDAELRRELDAALAAPMPDR